MIVHICLRMNVGDDGRSYTLLSTVQWGTNATLRPHPNWFIQGLMWSLPGIFLVAWYFRMSNINLIATIKNYQIYMNYWLVSLNIGTYWNNSKQTVTYEQFQSHMQSIEPGVRCLKIYTEIITMVWHRLQNSREVVNRENTDGWLSLTSKDWVCFCHEEREACLGDVSF